MYSYEYMSEEPQNGMPQYYGLNDFLENPRGTPTAGLWGFLHTNIL